MWTSATDHATPEAYPRLSVHSPPPSGIGGKADLFRRRSLLSSNAGVREYNDYAYDQHVVVEKEKLICRLATEISPSIPDRFFLINLNAARLACRQLGVKMRIFIQALSEYGVSLQP